MLQMTMVAQNYHKLTKQLLGFHLVITVTMVTLGTFDVSKWYSHIRFCNHKFLDDTKLDFTADGKNTSLPTNNLKAVMKVVKLTKQLFLNTKR